MRQHHPLFVGLTAVLERAPCLFFPFNLRFTLTTLATAAPTELAGLLFPPLFVLDSFFFLPFPFTLTFGFRFFGDDDAAKRCASFAARRSA